MQAANVRMGADGQLHLDELTRMTYDLAADIGVLKVTLWMLPQA
jgi:hypothetical protein